MAVIETWFHQDLQEPVKVNYLNGNLFSNNGNGNRIGVVLTNNGENLASISGTVSGYVVTADGSTVPCTGSKSGNRASILIPAAAYQPGSIFITVFVTDGTTVTTIGAVCTTVMRSRTNAQVDPGSTVTDWTQTINAAMQSVETAAANLGGIVAVPYASITFPVPLGKYTYYNNNLYRCITPIASSESFTEAHWTQVRLGDDVSDLKSAINVYPISLTNGYYIASNTSPVTLTPSSSSSFNNGGYAIVDCSEGDLFVINGTGTTAARLWAFIDSSNNVLLRADSGVNGNNMIIKAPANTSKLIINTTTYGVSTKYVSPTISAIDLTKIIKDIVGAEKLLIFEDGAIKTSDSTANPSSVVYLSTKHKHAVVDCNSGDTFIITGKGASDYRLWAFIDSSNNVLLNSAASVTEQEKKIIAPCNAAKLIVNVNASNAYALVKGQNVNALIDESKNGINEVIEDALNIKRIEMTLYGLVDVTGNTLPVSFDPVSSRKAEFAIVECSQGDLFTVNALGYGSAIAYAFLKSDKTIIKKAVSGTRVNKVLVAPENAAYLVINNYLNSATEERYVSYIGDVYEALPRNGMYNGYFRKPINIDTNSYQINIPSQRVMIGRTQADVSATTISYTGSATYIALFYDLPNNAFEVVYSASAVVPAGYFFMGAWGKGKESDASINGQFTVNNRYSDYNNIESNMTRYGKQDMAWVGNWIRPEAVSFNRIRNKLYWAYTAKTGAKGIACYDFDTGMIEKTNLAKLNTSDLHNDLAIHIFDDGAILCAYSTGHNDDNVVHIRKSVAAECIDNFYGDILLPSAGKVSYAQLLYSSSKLYLFYRVAGTPWSWAYRCSSDNGNTWSDEVKLIVSEVQYYCIFQSTTTDGVIRIVMYSNPQADSAIRDTSIRQAFFHTDTDTIYDSDNATSLGTSNVNKDDITVIIPNDATLTNQRLFDVAVSAIDRPMVLYAPFSTTTDSEYRLYDAGTVRTIVIGGSPLGRNSPYFLGAQFVGTDKIVAFHGTGANGGTDIGTLYAYDGSTISSIKNIWSEVRGSVPIRNFYPIVDKNKKAILWCRGYFGTTFTDFNTDAKIYLIGEDEVI